MTILPYADRDGGGWLCFAVQWFLNMGLQR